MRRYFDFASRPSVLVATFVATVVLLVTYTALPIRGELLDVRQGYSYDEAMSALAGYGADGRRLYALASVTVDTLLPFAFATCLAGLVYRFRPRENLRVLAWLPVVLGALDLGENAQVVTMLWQFPDIAAPQVAVASAFTMAKNAAFPACILLALVLAGWAVVRRAPARLGST